MKVQIFTRNRRNSRMLIFWLILTIIQWPQEGTAMPGDLESIRLEEAFHRIGEKYEVYFNYDRSIASDIMVEYEVGLHQSLKDAMSYVLKNTNLGYRIFDERFVVVFQNSAQGIESLKEMIGHVQGFVNERETVKMNNFRSVAPLTTLTAQEVYKRRLVFGISGTVVDDTGEALVGVNIMVKGTNKGTATDFEGHFILPDIDENAVLVVSYVGYQTQEVPVAGKSTLPITLKSDSHLLDEVVVVGYGTQKKSDLTGSIVRADIESFREAPNVSIVQSLQGTIPGLNIGQVDEAGETPSIQIRGRSTLNGNQDVLIVLDGIIFTGSLNDLNPNDIESIDVLKDPSSKSIYGAQAANGVMLITSKKGKNSSKPIFHYSGSFATQNPTTSDMVLQNKDQNIKRIFDMNWQSVYQAPEYTELKPGVTIDDIPISGSVLDLIKSGKEYDWWENTTDPGYIMSHNLGMQARKDDISYFISLGYTKQKGYILNDEYERIATRLNLSNEITKWLEIGVQSFGTFSDFSG